MKKEARRERHRKAQQEKELRERDKEVEAGEIEESLGGGPVGGCNLDG